MGFLEGFWPCAHSHYPSESRRWLYKYSIHRNVHLGRSLACTAFKRWTEQTVPFPLNPNLRPRDGFELVTFVVDPSPATSQRKSSCEPDFSLPQVMRQSGCWPWQTALHEWCETRPWAVLPHTLLSMQLPFISLFSLALKAKNSPQLWILSVNLTFLSLVKYFNLVLSNCQIQPELPLMGYNTLSFMTWWLTLFISQRFSFMYILFVLIPKPQIY